MKTPSWVELDALRPEGSSPSNWSVEDIRRRCLRFVWWIGVVILAVGLVVLVSHGWEYVTSTGQDAGNTEFFQGEFVANMVGMATTTALSFSLCGLALLVSATKPLSRSRRYVVLSATVLVIGWGSYGLAAFILRSHLALPTDSALPDAFSKPPMSAFTAAIFIVSGLALVATLNTSNLLTRRLASSCVCALGLINVLILLAYGHGIEFLKDILDLNVAVAPLTAATFLMLDLGLIFALGPNLFPLKPFVGPSPRAMMLRSFLPVVVGFLLLDSIVRGLIFHATDPSINHRLVIYSAGLCLASLVVTVLVVSFMAARIGGTIEKAEMKRDDALNRMAAMIDALGRTQHELEGAHQKATESNRLLAEANRDLDQARARAEQGSIEKDFFLATVSHELRTPLNHVIGYLQLLGMTELDEDQQSDLHKIHRAANSLLTLVNDLLDYQKMIQGLLTLEPTTMDLGRWVEEVADTMRPKVAERGNTLLVDCPADIGTLEADEKRVRQALTNLLSNAAKFTRDRTVIVSACRECDAHGEWWVRLDVRDTGRGMTLVEQGKLFQPFTKLVSRSENPDGTGLGLAISQRLCRLMGGDLALTHSEIGKGSTFTIRLPTTSTAVTPIRLPTKPAIPVVKTCPLRRPTSVMVIDDDPEVRELMRRHMEGQGFVVHLAASGSEALEKVKRLAPDAITLDVLMPGIDGWGTLAALQADAETAHIPVIMVTLLDDRSRGFALGAWEVLTKPVNWSQLIDLLRTIEPNAGPVLLVDADPAFHAMTMRTLNQLGWEVTCAEDGRSALGAAARRRPALVLLDLFIPGMDGFKFLEEFRKDPTWREVPVVVVTATDLTEEDHRRLEGQVLRVLTKGKSNMDELMREIERLLNHTMAVYAPPTSVSHLEHLAASQSE